MIKYQNLNLKIINKMIITIEDFIYLNYNYSLNVFIIFNYLYIFIKQLIKQLKYFFSLSSYLIIIFIYYFIIFILIIIFII